jgi:HNH endonuclease
MPVTEVSKRIIWVRAGGLCSIESCRRALLEHGGEADPDKLIGEVAHIVGRSEQAGPRSQFAAPGLDRDLPDNLLLLCPTCHQIVDQQVAMYTVERLRGIKERHERFVSESLRVRASAASAPSVKEDLHSTFFAVDRMPRYVYTAPCSVPEPEVRRKIRAPADATVLLPFIVRAEKLISFWPLTEAHGPFTDVISEPGAAERHESTDWWADPDLSSWYVTLLNRSLNKVTGRRGLNLDKEHSRYFFDPIIDEVEGSSLSDDGLDASGDPSVNASADESAMDRPVARVGLPREVEYRPMNKTLSKLRVAWQPVRRSTGEARKYWIHRAVGLRFHKVSPDQWILSVRPEHRFTTDGFTPLMPKTTGRRSASRKSHMYNIGLLHELQFWRDYLAEGAPFISLNFGQQTLVINAHYLQTNVDWPGVAGDAVDFSNARTEFDLFTSAAYHDALDANDDPEDSVADENADELDEDIDEFEVDEAHLLSDDARAVENEAR